MVATSRNGCDAGRSYSFPSSATKYPQLLVVFGEELDLANGILWNRILKAIEKNLQASQLTIDSCGRSLRPVKSLFLRARSLELLNHLWSDAIEQSSAEKPL